MNARDLIASLGGPQALIEITGLSKGRISQWGTTNHIPRPWLKFLREKFPQAVDWDELILSECASGQKPSECAEKMD